MKRAFTLIELLVVIAIIAILAAILFPVFAQAKAAAKKTQDLSNLKQIGTSTMLYVGDYDDVLYGHRWNCDNTGTGAATIPCPDYFDGSGNVRPEAANFDSDSIKRYYWVFMLQPYAKNYNLFANPAKTPFYPTGKTTQYFNAPGAKGMNYGGQNSYGHNDVYLSPGVPFGGGTAQTVNMGSIPRVASTIMIVDANYYGAAPDVANQSGIADTGKMNGSEVAYADAQGTQYKNYWKNLGNSDWSAGYATRGGDMTVTDAMTKIQQMHNGKLNVQWADGHAKSLDYKAVLGNICYWTTDADGAHPSCN
ncbi:prepilin-type N-terminal cleavage/methylation domain-containing protein [Fimbriimonas ginsengisoli]|uniref:Prepilin-type N-terminal cleavage/methylation domain-containing protein n=1 Tax=Fimbriimonas ginsengisoli Gsoil 348 TaxID=661478 RepID=A0A068NUE0_FIMGI|nr:prepilin-type N-terminal cleavage/methylation domain-containing protein [Fimbriimonas ginsengisoli]AIE86395.1 hypothetical protein OP10G_3027 [Fimbriimonas ginsengisoli Gsoil 348]